MQMTPVRRERNTPRSGLAGGQLDLGVGAAKAEISPHPDRRFSNILSSKFRKLKRIVVINSVNF